MADRTNSSDLCGRLIRVPRAAVEVAVVGFVTLATLVTCVVVPSSAALRAVVVGLAFVLYHQHGDNGNAPSALALFEWALWLALDVSSSSEEPPSPAAHAVGWLRDVSLVAVATVATWSANMPALARLVCVTAHWTCVLGSPLCMPAVTRGWFAALRSFAYLVSWAVLALVTPESENKGVRCQLAVGWVLFCHNASVLACLIPITIAIARSYWPRRPGPAPAPPLPLSRPDPRTEARVIVPPSPPPAPPSLTPPPPHQTVHGPEAGTATLITTTTTTATTATATTTTTTAAIATASRRPIIVLTQD
jgi:hypothetical protein